MLNMQQEGDNESLPEGGRTVSHFILKFTADLSFKVLINLDQK